MSGEFGENFKPNTKGDGAKHEDAEEKHDPFADARALKGADATPGSDSRKTDRAETAKSDVSDATRSLYDKSYNEKEHGPYHEFLAKNYSPDENKAMFERLMQSVEKKLAATSHFGTEVREASEAEVKRLFGLFEQIDKKSN